MQLVPTHASPIATAEEDDTPLSLFSFNDTATTEIYTLSLHDALPISVPMNAMFLRSPRNESRGNGSTALLTGSDSPVSDASFTRRLATSRSRASAGIRSPAAKRSEEHTFELQSLTNLVCRLLLEKKKK